MKVRRTTRLIVKLQRFAARPWYLPMIAGLAALDLFVGFIPSDGIVISSAMLKPRRWLRTGLWMACGSASGALLLGALAERFGEPVVRTLLPGVVGSAAWVQGGEFLRAYGALALALMSFGPLPQQPAVAICGLAHMPLVAIFLAVLAGRTAKYLLFAWTGAHGSRLLKGWRLARREAEALDAARESRVD
jgi:membrane protein YqaA with SNARE-associated domain